MKKPRRKITKMKPAPPPLGLFFGGMWVTPMKNQHERHGDHSTRRLGQHKHTYTANTKKTKTKRRGGGGGHIKEAERRPMRNTRPHRSKEVYSPPVVADRSDGPTVLGSIVENEKSGSTRVLRPPPVNNLGNGTRLSQDENNEEKRRPLPLCCEDCNLASVLGSGR